MKVLLLGAGGLLGSHLRRSAPEGIELVALGHAQLDITDARAVADTIGRVRPDWVMNAAALADVDAAETHRELAFAVNATGVSVLATACAEAECGLLHYSTDYVFDGAKDGFYEIDDRPNPLSVYGESKLEGERAARRCPRHLVIRTQWLFGDGRASLAQLMVRRAQERQPTRVVADQTGCFTWAADAARASWELLGRATGTLHVANRGRVSRYDLAKRIFTAMGCPELVAPCSADEFPRAARRPRNSALSVRRAEEILGREMPRWEDALDRYLGA